MDKQALIDLKAKVEAGAVVSWFEFVGDAFKARWMQYDAYRAYEGSVDAALRLLEAVLPGWTCSLFLFETVFVDNPSKGISVRVMITTTPARALLIAILSALISQA